MEQQTSKIKRSDLTLLLLYADNRYQIEGRTRFEKLIFLAQEEILGKWEEIVSSTSRFVFEPDRFGPLAVELYDEIEYLRSTGMLAEEAGNKYTITDLGIRFVESKVKPRVQEPIMKKIEELKRRWDRGDLESLLKYVYTKYPKYTVKSEIRDKILGY